MVSSSWLRCLCMGVNCTHVAGVKAQSMLQWEWVYIPMSKAMGRRRSRGQQRCKKGANCTHTISLFPGVGKSPRG